MIARMLVGFYLWWHGTLHLPGAGWLLRRCVSSVRSLQAFPFEIRRFGTAVLDFRDEAAFGIVNVSLGEIGDNSHLHAWIDKVLPNDGVFWDVGANVGYF